MPSVLRSYSSMEDAPIIEQEKKYISMVCKGFVSLFGGRYERRALTVTLALTHPSAKSVLLIEQCRIRNQTVWQGDNAGLMMGIVLFH